MAVEVQPDGRQVSIPVAVILDTRISLRARGVLAWLIANGSAPVDIDAWGKANRSDKTKPQLEVDPRESAIEIREGLRELQAAGYVERIAVEEGPVKSWRLVVKMNPSDQPSNAVASPDSCGTVTQVKNEAFPLTKAAAVAAGRGCEECDSIGMIETDTKEWEQCQKCKGSGIQ